jgi:hypothetical protein
MSARAAHLTEAEVRALRDRVYGLPTSDNNWDACRESWMRAEDTAWLQKQAGETPALPGGVQ